MRLFNLLLSTIILFAAVIMPVSAASKAPTEAIISWAAEGYAYRISEKTMLFQGSMDGIIYAHSGDEFMNEGFVRCPISQTIDLASEKSEVRGYCSIAVSAGNAIFAELSCKGVTGTCKGTFTFTSGTGKFKGISGTSKLTVRSPLQTMIEDVSSGSTIKTASGIAVLSDVKFKIAGKN
jgi:hypothetical protein